MYVTQIAASPPRLVFFSNLERNIPAHYIRFLKNRFRSALGLTGTPLRLMFRKRTAGGEPRSNLRGERGTQSDRQRRKRAVPPQLMKCDRCET